MPEIPFSILNAFQSEQRRPEEDERISAARREDEIQQGRERELQAKVEQVKAAREEVETALLKLQSAANSLKDHVRRSRDDSAASYTVFANAYLRTASAVTSGLKRTSAMDRLLVRAKTEKDEQLRYEEETQRRKASREAQQRIQKLTLPMTDEDALAEVYGEVLNAE